MYTGLLKFESQHGKLVFYKDIRLGKPLNLGLFYTSNTNSALFYAEENCKFNLLKYHHFFYFLIS